jgi:hypothetical protein
VNFHLSIWSAWSAGVGTSDSSTPRLCSNINDVIDTAVPQTIRSGCRFGSVVVRLSYSAGRLHCRSSRRSGRPLKRPWLEMTSGHRIPCVLIPPPDNPSFMGLNPFRHLRRRCSERGASLPDPRLARLSGGPLG